MSYSDLVRDRLNKTGQFHPENIARMQRLYEEERLAREQRDPIPNFKPKKLVFAVTMAIMQMQQQRFLTDQQRVLHDVLSAKQRESDDVVVHKTRTVGKSEVPNIKLRKGKENATANT
jgi:hypothetical protein